LSVYFVYLLLAEGACGPCMVPQCLASYLSAHPTPSVTSLLVNYGQEWLCLYRRITNVNNSAM